MADKTTIINRALSLLGAEPIVNITDNTPEAQIANRFYDESRQSVLSETLWNFAKTQAQLNRISGSVTLVVDERQYRYQLPSDVIRIFYGAPDWATWERVGEEIYADTNEFGIVYVYDLTDTTKFTPSFVDAFADKLAADMCYSVISSNTEAKLLLEKYHGESLPKAMAENAQEGIARDIDDSLWSNSRFGHSPVDRQGRIIA